MKTNKDKGKMLEMMVAQKLQEVFRENPPIRPTKASGASTQLGDILCSHFLVECKKRNTKSITINNKVWNHLIYCLPINSQRTPLLVLENQDNKRWAVLDFEDFCRLIKEKK